jgi:hypothetical protein
MEIFQSNFPVLIFGAVFLLVGTMAWGAWSAAPWVPLWRRDVDRMIGLADIKLGEKVYDLGAGDGRIVIAAAKKGGQAIGFEISVLPYILGCIKIIVGGLWGKVRMSYKNFFTQDLSDADVIFTFLTPHAMEKLKPKLEKTKSGCRIVSYAFEVPGWSADKKDKPAENITAIYLYRR